MLKKKLNIDPILLAIAAIIAINKVQSALQEKRAPAEETRDALVLRAYYLGLQYPGCSHDPFLETNHPLKSDLRRSFCLGAGTPDTTIENPAVIH